jgi:hypothetical protein
VAPESETNQRVTLSLRLGAAKKTAETAFPSPDAPPARTAPPPAAPLKPAAP